MLAAVIILSVLVVVLFFIVVHLWRKSSQKPKNPPQQKNIETNEAVPDIPAEKLMNLDDPYDQQKRIHGKIGEQVVYDHLKELIENEKGYLFQNFCFENENGYSCEIDTLLICQGGIFVIEVKNMKGLICGKRESKEWNSFRQNPYERPVEFKNPISQNQKHIRYLSNLFPGNPPKMISMIIFLNGDLSRVPYPEIKRLQDGLDYIQNSIASKKYSAEFVERVYHQIVAIKEEYGITRERHLENILRYRENDNMELKQF